ncbi:MAG: DNA polymerase III, subunit gamma and tau, partial [Porphyromonadaceae bacterium]|nr:DNA polymerase III, subunit gamma and tau [Porphyromonadaceae bacterium]
AQTAPVAPPAPQAAPKPAPAAGTPPPAAAEPTPAPAPAPAASATPPPPPPPPAPTSSAPKRLFGARRRADAPSEASSTAPAEAPAPVEDKDFTEDDLQRAWVRFVEQELTPSQILYRNILRPELPKLLDGVQAEISLPPGEAIHTTVMEVYPQLVEFLRTTLQNRKFNLVLREKTVEEQAKIVLTQEDRFNQLAEINPEVRKLKEALGLRFS